MSAPERYPDFYRQHLTGDPAHDKAFAALADCPAWPQIAAALRTYAHELAEKIRPTGAEPTCCDTCALAYATRMDDADLIDPGV